MDAATRSELQGLRRRAFGPEADIDADDEALLRLIELEELVLHDHDEAPDETASTVQAEPPRRRRGTRHPLPPPGAADPPPGDEPPGKASQRPRRRWPAIVGAAVALAVVAFTAVRLAVPPEEPPNARPTLSAAFQDGRAAYSFARDTEAVTLLQIPLDGSFGGFINLPGDGHVPEFPTDGQVDWAVHLGEYYGWDAWIAGAIVDTTWLRREHCVLVERGEMTRGRCVPAAIRSESALLVDIPYTYTSDEDRPAGMTEDQRLGFWWHRDEAVTVLLGDDPVR
ncbi:hypothetical protein [Microbacterium sp. HJ5]